MPPYIMTNIVLQNSLLLCINQKVTIWKTIIQYNNPFVQNSNTCILTVLSSSAYIHAFLFTSPNPLFFRFFFTSHLHIQNLVRRHRSKRPRRSILSQFPKSSTTLSEKKVLIMVCLIGKSPQYTSGSKSNFLDVLHRRTFPHSTP